jgi:hypothetical protein
MSKFAHIPMVPLSKLTTDVCKLFGKHATGRTSQLIYVLHKNRAETHQEHRTKRGNVITGLEAELAKELEAPPSWHGHRL